MTNQSILNRLDKVERAFQQVQERSLQESGLAMQQEIRTLGYEIGFLSATITVQEDTDG